MTAVSEARVVPPRRRVTPDALRMIPQWLADGATRADIADALGITVGSLTAICSRHGISLASSAAKTRSQGLESHLGWKRWEEIRRRAEVRGVTPHQLVVRLLVATVDGNLFDAVLDDAEDVE